MKNTFCLLFVFLSFSNFAQNGQQENDWLFDVYRTLHSEPELSLKEEKTSLRLIKELDKLGLKYTYPLGGFGIAGVIENGSGPTILLRTDMDALPINEETNATYKSKNAGVMHACGHDIHMSIWLGTLKYLSENKNLWKGKILFVAQPAEEIGQGAKNMLEDGLYAKYGQPEMCLALHTNADLPAGQIGICSGWFMANVDMLKITVRSTGGHGAAPHQVVDPVVIAAKIILNLQTIVSREINPTETAVITVGAIHGGKVGNIIPNKVEMELTVRSFSDESRTYILKAIERTCKTTAQSAGVPDDMLPEMEVRDMFTPALYNNPKLAAKATQTFTDLWGAENVITQEKLTIGEDFSRYGLGKSPCPVFMFSLGTINPEEFYEAKKTGNSIPKLHSSMYLPDYKKAIPVGIKSMSRLLIALSTTYSK